jgi:hypothetical protein
MLSRFFKILSMDLLDADKKAESGLSNLKKRKELLIGSHKIKIDRKIAEGGYADIYRVTDVTNGSMFHDVPYALKRMFIETDAKEIKETSNQNNIQ